MLTKKEKTIVLRKQGKTYTEIRQALNTDTPKSTMSYWCKNVVLPPNYQAKIIKYNKINLEKGRQIALNINMAKKEKQLELIKKRIAPIKGVINNKDAAKVVLAVLYAAEGSHNPKRGSIMFGNSDPFIVSLFMRLIRMCYPVNEEKFRCTVQCRADQNTGALENFWRNTTKIPSSQFYKTRIDPRTIGKPSKKPDYKGVCRIDYFSTEVLNELLEITKIIS